MSASSLGERPAAAASRVLGVAHTGLTVSDMDRAVGFFGGVLGGEVTPPALYDDPVFARITGVGGAAINIAYVDFPGHRLELLHYLTPKAEASALSPCNPGHLHLSLVVDGIDDLVVRMAAAGFTPAGPVQHVDLDGGFRLIYTYGFDGLVIELMDFSEKRLPSANAHG